MDEQDDAGSGVGSPDADVVQPTVVPQRQRELLDTRTWETPEQLGAAIFEWIEAWYNPRRRHTALGMLSPIDYEKHWQRHQVATTALHTAANGAA